MTTKEIVDIIWAVTGAICVMGFVGMFIYCTIKVMSED